MNGFEVLKHNGAHTELYSDKAETILKFSIRIALKETEDDCDNPFVENYLSRSPDGEVILKNLCSWSIESEDQIRQRYANCFLNAYSYASSLYDRELEKHGYEIEDLQAIIDWLNERSQQDLITKFGESRVESIIGSPRDPFMTSKFKLKEEMDEATRAKFGKMKFSASKRANELMSKISDELDEELKKINQMMKAELRHNEEQLNL